jgi:hypothetical protein
MEHPPMSKIKQAFDSAKKWIDRNFTFKGLIVFLWGVLTTVPRWFGIKNFWSTHLILEWKWLSEYSAFTVPIVCALLIWLDHRRVLNKRGKPVDDTTLKGRALKLRDGLEMLLEEAESIPVDANVREGNFYTQASARWEKIAHGYELRFASDIKRICHELGESGFSDTELLLCVEKPHQTKESCTGIVDALFRLAKEVDRKTGIRYVK